MSAANRRLDAARRFRTFGGVFTPCTLTILGVIMFLRFGQVVGQSGLINAVIIVLLAKVITTLTTLSLSAVATNTRVQGGGAYFLISRSLGVEFGGAIGVVFYLAQTISVALYVIGFTEALVDVFPHLAGSFRLVASVVNCAVFISVFIGAGWTIRIQYGILAALAVSLLSFYAGAATDFSMTTLRSNLSAHYVDGANFTVMFALFFPAVTGIMAGANMSGDLIDPGRSIPRGTLSAIGVTAVVYLSIAVLFAGSRTQPELVADNLIMKGIALSAPLVTLGVFAATISSALGSMMGAPRILQAFARDGIFKRMALFSKGSGKNLEPRRAIVLTFAISQVTIYLGDLDAIAPIITMFFLITYGLLNLASFYESYTNNPSFRPRFKASHWSSALLGTLGCVIVMFLIAPVWAIAAVISMVGLHSFISRKNVIARWGDVKSGVAFEQARKGLLRLEDEKYHPKNWRPIILALSGGTWNRINLVVYAHWLTAGHGILSLAHIIVGDLFEHLKRRENQERLLRKAIRSRELDAFPVVTVSETLNGGVISLLQDHGLGGIRPNTVMIGWSANPERYEQFGSTLRTITLLGRSVVALKCGWTLDDSWTPPPGDIDVWWRGRENGSLMLLLAHLLRQNDRWRTKRIRILRAIADESGRGEAEAHMHRLLEESRIEAEPVAVVAKEVTRAIQETSAGAAVVFLGFKTPAEGSEHDFMRSVEGLCGDLRSVLLVSSAGGMALDV